MQLATLSPLLSTMDSIEIPMPMLSGNLATTAVAGTAAVGQGATQITNSSLTVSAFGANVELLKTRTRPKKIQLVASDGRSCTFLLKVVLLAVWICASYSKPLKPRFCNHFTPPGSYLALILNCS